MTENIEETHTRKVEESRKEYGLLFGDVLNYDQQLMESIWNWHIHQLQKAREESIKILDVADIDTPPFPSAKDSESARIGFITGLAWARTKLHSELDQEVSK